MKLSEILDSLASSELANLNFVENGNIAEAKIPKIVNAINLGLVKLYTRFKLKKGFITLSVTPEVTAYELTSANVLSGLNTSGFITTTGFSGDLIEILNITDSSDNDISFDGSGDVVLLKTNLIKFKTAPEEEDTYTVEYSALPTRLVYVDDTNIEVELPDVYLPPLLMFIGSRFASPVGISFDANRSSMDINYLQQYEAECQKLDMLGLDVGNDIGTDLFSERGFV